MSELEGNMQVVKGGVQGMSKTEIADFYREVQTYPVDARQFVYDLSKVLIEPDIHGKIMNDKDSIRGIKDRFNQYGIGNAKIKHILRYFNLPDMAEETSSGTSK